MPTSRTASRAAATARTEVLGQLKEDHKRVKKAYREFQKLDSDEDAEACGALVRQVLDELSVHAAVEEELVYPAARSAIADESLVDEAEVEHESLHALIDQLRDMEPGDDKFSARFTVLCEYVLHHVKEEEGELFPELERARLDWESLAAEVRDMRQQDALAKEEEPSGDDPATLRGPEARAEDQPLVRARRAPAAASDGAQSPPPRRA